MPEPTRVRIPVLSLFSGAGGLDLGFENVGFEPLLALDWDESAVDTYNRNRPLPAHGRQADLLTTPPGHIMNWWREAAIAANWVDSVGSPLGPVGIIGGPPCQAFSISNVHPIEDDPRAKAPLAYARILSSFNKRWTLEFFVFENVTGLGTSKHADSLREFKKRFELAGFENVDEFYLNADEFGVPQTRRRVFIAGMRAKSGYVFERPTPAGTAPTTVEKAIGQLVPSIPFNRQARPRDVGLHPNHWHMNPRSRKFRDPGGPRPQGRSFRKLEWSKPSPTVAYGHREMHIHPNGDRRISVLEAMLLQGFPVTYELRGTMSAQIRQVSDAVPPPLAAALARSVLAAIGTGDRPANAHPARIGQSPHRG